MLTFGSRTGKKKEKNKPKPLLISRSSITAKRKVMREEILLQ